MKTILLLLILVLPALSAAGDEEKILEYLDEHRHHEHNRSDRLPEPYTAEDVEWFLDRVLTPSRYPERSQRRYEDDLRELRDILDEVNQQRR